MPCPQIGMCGHVGMFFFCAHQAFTFNPLQLYHAGNYTCMVTVSGLTGNFSQSAAQIITVESKHTIYVLIPIFTHNVHSDTPAWKVYVHYWKKV